MNRRDGRVGVSWIQGAMRWSGEECLAARGFNHPRYRRAGHGAVMCTVAAAASGQARIVAGFESRGERPKPEEEQEE